MWSAAVCSKFSCMQVVNVYQVVGFDPWWVTQILHKCVVEVNLQVDVLSSHCFVRFVRVLHNLHILDYLFNKFWLQGLRERWLADPRFLQRLAIEETISITTTLIAQYERRGDRFWKEIEYVITDSVRGAVVDFFTVWLPAPTLSFRTLDAQVFCTSGCVFAVFLNP